MSGMEAVKVAKTVARLADKIVEQANLLAKYEGVKTGNGNGNGHKASPGLKLQGRYMGLIRTMGPRKKAHYRGIRAEKGIRAAIKAMQRDRA